MVTFSYRLDGTCDGICFDAHVCEYEFYQVVMMWYILTCELELNWLQFFSVHTCSSLLHFMIPSSWIQPHNLETSTPQFYLVQEFTCVFYHVILCLDEVTQFLSSCLVHHYFQIFLIAMKL